MADTRSYSVTGDGKHAEPRHLLLAGEPVQITVIACLDGAVRLQEKRKPSHLDFCVKNRAYLTPRR